MGSSAQATLFYGLDLRELDIDDRYDGPTDKAAEKHNVVFQGYGRHPDVPYYFVAPKDACHNVEFDVLKVQPILDADVGMNDGWDEAIEAFCKEVGVPFDADKCCWQMVATFYE